MITFFSLSIRDPASRTAEFEGSAFSSSVRASHGPSRLRQCIPPALPKLGSLPLSPPGINNRCSLTRFLRSVIRKGCLCPRGAFALKFYGIPPTLLRQRGRWCHLHYREKKAEKLKRKDLPERLMLRSLVGLFMLLIHLDSHLYWHA